MPQIEERCHWQRSFSRLFLVHVQKKCGQNVDKTRFSFHSPLIFQEARILQKSTHPLCHQAFTASATATATATVAPTIGLLPMPFLIFYVFPRFIKFST
jgi:hypothetical protein